MIIVKQKQKIGKSSEGIGNKIMSEDQTTTLLKESWRLEETCCHSISSGRPSANTGVESS